MKLVISAVNFTEGGPLTVLREIVRAAADHFPQWEVVVMVHRLGTVQDDRVTEMAFPAPKSSWLRRLALEWWGFMPVSRELAPDVWLSLHDITPRVQARRQYVYCHNPAPFCTVDVPALRHDRKFLLFRRYYGLLYRCLIQRNTAVIVQQDWLRRLFQERFGVKRVIVAHPEVTLPASAAPDRHPDTGPIRRFLYPAFPRVFKNFELLGECALRLERDPLWNGEILVTIDGSENSYAAEMKARYGHCRTLRFIGLQSPELLAALYRNVDALVFPSLLETWGLPLTEAKMLGLPIVAADLPYAHETVGTSDNVSFVDPFDAADITALLIGLHTGSRRFGRSTQAPPPEPYANGWKELLDVILVDDRDR